MHEVQDGQGQREDDVMVATPARGRRDTNPPDRQAPFYLL